MNITSSGSHVARLEGGADHARRSGPAPPSGRRPARTPSTARAVALSRSLPREASKTTTRPDPEGQQQQRWVRRVEPAAAAQRAVAEAAEPHVRAAAGAFWRASSAPTGSPRRLLGQPARQARLAPSRAAGTPTGRCRPTSPRRRRRGCARSSPEPQPEGQARCRPPRTSRRLPGSRTRAGRRRARRASSSSRRRPRDVERTAYSASHTVAALAMAHELGLVEANRLRPERHRGDHHRQPRRPRRNRPGASAASDATSADDHEPVEGADQEHGVSPGRRRRARPSPRRTPAGTRPFQLPQSVGVSGTIPGGSASWQRADCGGVEVVAGSTDHPRGDEPDVRVAVGVRGAGVADAAGAPDRGEVEVVVG